MPYQWTQNDTPIFHRELRLWPHELLAPKGFTLFIGATCTLISVPLLSVLGSVVLWGLLPFFLLAVGGVWFALKASHRNAQIIEVLNITNDSVNLFRRNPNGDTQEWDCKLYWVRIELHKTDGPVPNYVTLGGGGRNVEIGAFLSEPERVSLYEELSRELNKAGI